MKISKQWTDLERMLAVERIIRRWREGKTPAPAWREIGEDDAAARQREAWNHVSMLVACSTPELERNHRESIEEMVGREEQ